mgnify:CR=1 FL=1
MKKAIIVGATSGIGKGLAKILADNNYTVGITGRRTELLEELKSKNSMTTKYYKMIKHENERYYYNVHLLYPNDIM